MSRTDPVRARPVGRSSLTGDPRRVGPGLIGLVLVHGERAGRIVEVEAYRGSEDPASHAFGGPTARNGVMYGPAGHLYVYFTYGMHFCANVVCGNVGVAGAVLFRALEPVAGVEAMRLARSRHGARAVPPDRELCRGPGNLCQALGIDRSVDGVDLCDPASPVRLVGRRRPVTVLQGPRIGITRAVDEPWRYWEAGSRWVSGRASDGIGSPAPDRT